MQLTDPLADHFRLAKTQQKALEKLGVATLRDLLYHFPVRYENISDIKQIADLAAGDSAIVYGTVGGLKTRKAFRRRTPIAEGWVEDGSGRIKIIWFNQPYLAKMVQPGAVVKLAGKVTGGKTGGIYLANPEIEPSDATPLGPTGSLFSDGKESALFPVYPESRGVSSRWFYHATDRLFKGGVLDMIEDPIPEDILARYKLPALESALVWIHKPRQSENALAARKRFAFEEVFFIQLAKQRDRARMKQRKSFPVRVDRDEIGEFVSRFPFTPTRAQLAAIDDICTDFAKQTAMARLLEGDVGSGKTAVAASTVYAAVTTRPEGKDFGNLQVAYMAPTEILARQQFESFVEYFSHLPISIGLITSSGCKKFPSKVDPTKATDISRSQLLKWVANGEIPILVGTHALIQKSVSFKNLAYVIIDEQHRFGTYQRQKLARKDGLAPHLLSMTATPIPRTLALTIYGDLDLTLLDEMPQGRKPVKTAIVLSSQREAVYEDIRAQLAQGRQLYVICPRIDEPDPKKELALNAKSVTEEAMRLKKEVFPEYEIEILHSKMKPADKDEVMRDFASGAINILVATSVVEVGVNVPNATIILIEGAERFGLAQLHQLRGRVLRSTHQAYCYVFAETKSKKSLDRLQALSKAANGFELAEQDLTLRGSGELYGRRQWGLSDIAMEALKNIKMVEAARKEAARIVKDDPDLESLPLMRERIAVRTDDLHFE
jgi:ATP-dependent DNA helicase RecG